MQNQIENLFTEQLLHWELARSNYQALKKVKTKTLDVNGCAYKVQFNPARLVSSGAKVDTRSIQQRKCFLCEENRPPEQKGILFTPVNHLQDRSLFPLQGVRGQGLTILVNPFPIFPKHFTIPDATHTPQLIAPRFADMLALAEYMSDYVVFYNGPKSGASAPDHAHFQAGNKGFLPIEKEWKNHIEKTIFESENTKLHVINYGFPAFILFAPQPPEGGVEEQMSELNAVFEKIYKALSENNEEPMMNILAWFDSSTHIPPSGGRGVGNFVVAIFPRKKHRPDCYFAEGKDKMMISPGLVDVAGVFITAREIDFEKITASDVKQILTEVCLSNEEMEEIIKKIN